MESQQIVQMLVDNWKEIAGAIAAGIAAEAWAGFSKRFPRYRGLVKRVIDAAMKGTKK